MARYLLDTNIILRIAAPMSPQYPITTRTVEQLLLRGEQLLLAPQIVMEFWAAATRPLDVNGYGWSAKRAEDKVAELREQFPLLPETSEVFDEWVRLVCGHAVLGKRTHDARLVAWMNTHGIRDLLTFNVGDFKRYDIVAVSPEDI
jgi:predicted nucleic acid-binding protein